ncbi:MAG: hypothetical protein GXP17_07710 [Gammaproteobacteria bacterium]|nr:hypothetical protein [Gammaproteobacteria bacterium]
MALLWQKKTKDTCYEVRTAGQSRRLYSNGVFHSQYHPQRKHSGGVWDLLVLPALFRPPHRIRRVLVLGVGGGSAIHLLRHFVAPEQIVGVELNKTHLQVARQFFGIKKDMAELHHADAVHWLNAYNGPAFDMIIDDLFGNDTNTERAVPADSPWCQTLLKNLNRNGILVMNFIGSKAMRTSACVADPAIARHFKSTFQLSLPAYENVIGVFSGAPANSKILRQRINDIPELNRARLGFRIRKLKTS